LLALGRAPPGTTVHPIPTHPSMATDPRLTPIHPDISPFPDMHNVPGEKNTLNQRGSPPLDIAWACLSIVGEPLHAKSARAPRNDLPLLLLMATTMTKSLAGQDLPFARARRSTGLIPPTHPPPLTTTITQTTLLPPLHESTIYYSEFKWSSPFRLTWFPQHILGANLRWSIPPRAQPMNPLSPQPNPTDPSMNILAPQLTPKTYCRGTSKSILLSRTTSLSSSKILPPLATVPAQLLVLTANLRAVVRRRQLVVPRRVAARPSRTYRYLRDARCGRCTRSMCTT